MQYFAKYLGVMVGPQGQENAWEAQTITLKKKARRIKACKLPLRTAANYYNVYGSSVLSHVAQYRAPSQALRMAEAGVLATVCAAPMNALPRDCLEHLQKIGFRSQYKTIQAMSLAARCRVAMSSPAHAAAVQLLREAADSPDALLHPPTGWSSISIVEEVQAA